MQWQGRDIHRLREAYYRQIVYISHANGLKGDLSAEENLTVAAQLNGVSVARSQVQELLHELGLASAAGKPVARLSQGQCRRVALARLWLASEKPLWILDEPFAALDADAVQASLALLKTHLDRGGMLVYTTHQPVQLAPAARSFRIGGMVETGSLQRQADGLTVHFIVTDMAQRMPVVYRGILPELFKEGKGVVAQGRLGENGLFVADQVLAKHDENYMPPEAAHALKAGRALAKDPR